MAAFPMAASPARRGISLNDLDLPMVVKSLLAPTADTGTTGDRPKVFDTLQEQADAVKLLSELEQSSWYTGDKDKLAAARARLRRLDATIIGSTGQKLFWIGDSGTIFSMRYKCKDARYGETQFIRTGNVCAFVVRDEETGVDLTRLESASVACWGPNGEITNLAQLAISESGHIYANLRGKNGEAHIARVELAGENITFRELALDKGEDLSFELNFNNENRTWDVALEYDPGWTTIGQYIPFKNAESKPLCEG